MSDTDEVGTDDGLAVASEILARSAEMSVGAEGDGVEMFGEGVVVEKVEVVDGRRETVSEMLLGEEMKVGMLYGA